MTSQRDFQEHRTRKPEQNTAANHELNPQEHDLVTLQRQIGNQAVQRLMAQGRLNLSDGALQTKMTVGEADDQYEQEADQVASEVMKMSDDEVHRENFNEDDEEGSMHLKPISSLQRDSVEDEPPDVSNHTESTIESMRGGGQSMPDDTRNFMESRFGQDFGDVNIHTGAESDTLNRDLNARAFTTGGDIFFRQGEYNPNSSDGKELLAHELTHVVQQGASTQLQNKEDDQA